MKTPHPGVYENGTKARRVEVKVIPPASTGVQNGQRNQMLLFREVTWKGPLVLFR